MKVLAIDTSSIVATVAIIEDEKLLGEIVINHKKNHSEKLMPNIRYLLEESDIDIREIDLFGVSIGPGSFTGIRIGVATMKALAQVGHKPIIGISTLEGLVYNLNPGKALICPILDAQRNQIYTSLYRWEKTKLLSLEEERAIGAKEWIEKLKERKEDIFLLGDGVAKFGELFKESLGERISIVPASLRMPRASSIASLALEKAVRGEVSNYKDISPHYIRKSQAEQSIEIKN